MKCFRRLRDRDISLIIISHYSFSNSMNRYLTWASASSTFIASYKFRADNLIVKLTVRSCNHKDNTGKLLKRS